MDIVTSSKDIDELKKEEESAFKQFTEFKTKFNEINQKLYEKLVEIRNIREELDKFKKIKRKEKETKEHEILKTKELDVEEKIKTRKKLTTEDLLVFQKLNKD